MDIPNGMDLLRIPVAVTCKMCSTYCANSRDLCPRSGRRSAVFSRDLLWSRHAGLPCVCKALLVGLLLAGLHGAVGFNLDTEKHVEFRGEHPGSYFGYSLAMINLDARNQWLLFGAPRDNSSYLPDVNEPGAIYKCTIQQNGKEHSCMELFVDDKVGIDSAPFAGVTRIFEHGRDGQWLGAALDVSSTRGVVTCASRWYNTYYLTDGYFLMNGMCYELPLDFSPNNVRKIPALINGTHQTENVNNVTKYLYGMGGLGMSAHYTEQGHDLLLGAPGLRTWTGGFVDLRQNDVFFPEYVNRATEISELLGYAMTSGEYFANDITYFAVGAPRDDLTGKVYLYRGNRLKYVVENADKILTGTEGNKIKVMPVNSYYGAALCSCDVNKDGRDDLLVAAPLFSNAAAQDVAMEEGVVLVYLGDRDLTFNLMPELLTGSRATQARFGTAMACLGDLNKDSYNDVVVGAPYEDDMQGAIYVYNGCKTGVWPRYSQRIPASKMATGLTSFGISFSKPADMNDDNVNDIAVGAYLSDRAYLMFGQSVINVNMTMDSVAVIDVAAADSMCTVGLNTRAACFDVRVCYRYLDADLPYIVINATIDLDTLMGAYPRLAFLETRKSQITEVVRLLSAESVCWAKKVYVKAATNLVTPALLRTSYRPVNILAGLYIPPTLNVFDGSNPDRNLLVATKVVHFKKDCPNNECNTDLRLAAEAAFDSVGGFFVLGTPVVALDVRISKSGDPSYSSNLFIAVPKYLGYQKVTKHFGDPDVNCGYLAEETDEPEGGETRQADTLADLVNQNIPEKSEDEFMLVCSFGNPLYNDTGVSFSVIFGVPATLTVTDFRFRLNATTLSTEQNVLDNTKTVEVKVRNQVAIDFNGVSVPSFIRIDDTGSEYLMSHTYELRNRGPSPLPSASLTIRYPQVQTGGKPQLFLNKTTWSCPPPCNITCSFTEEPGTAPAVQVAAAGPTYYNSEGPEPSVGEARQLKEIKALNCLKASCSGYLCSLTNIPARESAVVSMDFVVAGNILDVISDGEARTARSEGYVRLKETSRLITSETSQYTQVPTQILPLALPPKTLPWWVYLLSVLGGILLIFLIALIFWKCGFFRRTKREEMRKMQHTGEVEKMLSDDQKA